MDQGSTTCTAERLRVVKDLHDSTAALNEFARCLDPQFKNLHNWQLFAFTLGVPSDVIRTCKLYLEHSPTIRVFEHLEVTNPQLTIGELQDVLTRNQRRARHDIKAMLKGFGNEDKVSEVITNSTTVILDEIALKLDSASKPTCDWKDFCLELDIARDKLQQFEMYVNYNPTEALFRYLYATSKESVKLSKIVEFLQQMGREDVLQEVRNATQSTDIDTKDAKDVFKLGSKLLDGTSRRLNKDDPCVEGWRVLARRLIDEQFIDDPDIIPKLEPPRQHEIHSPTKKIIEWLAANKPQTKLVDDILGACKEINRNDAGDVLMKYFSRASEFSYDDEDCQSSSLPYSVQETSESENILKAHKHRFGLPGSTAEFNLRGEERDDLVSKLTGGQQKLVVLHSPAGYGKTSLVLSVADELVNSHDYTCIYVNSKGIFSLEDFAVKTLTTCGIPAPPSEGKERIKELFKNLGQKCLFILDNFDHMFHANDKTQHRVNRSTSDPVGTSSEIQGVPHDNPQSLSQSFSGVSTDIPGTSSKSRKVSGLAPWENITSEKDDYQNFLLEIIQSVPKSAPNFQVLATTWEAFTTTKVSTKQVELRPLTPEQSKKFMLHKCKSILEIEESKISDDLVNQIVKCCSGIPLLLCSAVGFIGSFASFDDGANQLVLCPPEELSTKLSLDDLPHEERFNHCLGICFDRLDDISKTVLIIASVFPGPFTTILVETISKEIFPSSNLEKTLSVLKRFNFLCNKEGSSYYMSSAIKSFVFKMASETDMKQIYHDALSKYVDHSFGIISETEKIFFSGNCKDAIQKYRDQEENLREIARWCISDKLSIDPNVKHRIIESFAKYYWINMKLMKTHLLKIIICKFAQLSKGINDKHRIESLIFGGATFVKGCLCSPHLCPRALGKAMWCFKKAIKAISLHRSTTSPTGKWMLDKVIEVFHLSRSQKKSLNDLETITKCEIISDAAKTEMLVKYGKCLARCGLADGLAFIRTGIEKRQRILKKDSSNPKNHVMVALGYNDLACAYSYLSDAGNTYMYRSIEIRENMVLPVFREHLGTWHPFTSSALSHLAHAYHALQNYDKAIKTCATALKNRSDLLGEHHDTASSWFDMGHIRSEQASLCDDPVAKQTLYEEALANLKESLEMREKLAYTPRETAQTHQEIADVLQRLGRDEDKQKAKEHDEKIYYQMKKIDDKHLNEP